MRNHLKISGLVLLLVSLFSLNISAKEIKLNAKGISLNANLELVKGSVPSETVILMTHGTLAHGKMEIMSQLQDLFKENEFDSLSITLGLGLNDRKGMYDCATKHTHKHTDAVDEIGLWVNWLKAQGVKNIILLGHSRGGNQTAWYAAEAADAVVKKVILIAPATWDSKYAKKDYKKRYKKDLKTVLAKAETLLKNGKGKTVMKNTDHIYCEKTSVTAESFVSYYKPDNRFNTPSLLEKIKVPVMVFAGSEDKVVKDLEKKVSPLVKKGGINLEVIDGAGHMFRDLYAEDLVDIALEFIKPE